MKRPRRNQTYAVSENKREKTMKSKKLKTTKPSGVSIENQ
jgi:hypothetical protein